MKDLREVVDEIHQKVDIVEFIQKYVKLKKQGKNYVGLCPFHKEKTPSFVVSGEKQLYHCFGCGASGDVVTFLMKFENLSFKEAITEIAKEAGIEIPAFLPSDNIKRETLYQINEELANYFSLNLREEHINYLIKRGLSTEAIKKFRLGFAKEHDYEVYEFLIKKGFVRDDILITGNFYVEKSNTIIPYFRNRIMIPIFDLNGKIVGFSGRAFDNSEPKYLNSLDSPIFKKGEILYLINFAKDEIKKNKAAIIVEGYFDAMVLSENGFKNVVSTMGTAFTEAHALLLRRFASYVYFFFDNDLGGKTGLERATEVVMQTNLIPKAIIIEENLDPDEIVLRFGNTVLNEAIENAKDPIMFILDYELSNSDGTPEAKSRIIEKMLYMLSNIPNRTLVFEYLKNIAAKTKVDEEFILDSFKKITSKNRVTSKNSISEKEMLYAKFKDKMTQTIEILTQALMQRPELTNKILEEVDINDFLEPYKTIALRAKTDVEEGRIPNPNSWIFLDESVLKKAVELYFKDPILVRDEAVKEFLNTYREIKDYELKLNEIFNEIKNSNGDNKERLMKFQKLLKNYKSR